MIKKLLNYIVDFALNESSAATISNTKDLVIGNVPAPNIRAGINKLYEETYNPEAASKKFEKSIESYKEALK